MSWVYSHNAGHPRPHHFAMSEAMTSVHKQFVQTNTLVRLWVLSIVAPMKPQTFFINPRHCYEIDWQRPHGENSWYLIKHDLDSNDPVGGVRLICTGNWLAERVEFDAGELAAMFKLRWSE